MSGHKALVVDDSRAVRTILTRALRGFGYEADEAEDGLQALQILEGCPARYQLALVDWNMPVMNGLELIRRLRARPEFAALLIVMVTTETEMSHVGAALEAGANEYVMKPFTTEVLFSKLEIVGGILS